MRGVIYVRVSLDKNEGRSVEDQERECRAECERRGWPVRAVYRDVSISASRYGKKARPEWEKCKNDLRPDDVLCLWESSRSTRDVQEFVELRNTCAEIGVLLSYSGKVLDLTKGDDRFTGGLDALLAERESEQFRERVLRGKRSGVKAGRPAGRVGWGFRITGPGQREPDPFEAPRVREAVERFIAGHSLNSIWQWLTETEGFTPGSRTMLRQALSTPSLAGLRVHRGEVVGKANWEPIITEAQHRQVLARMKARRSGKINSGPEPRHLLSGIAKCGKEGCPDYVSWRRNAYGTPIYVCRRGHLSRLADPIDKAVEEALFIEVATMDHRQYDDDDPEVKKIWDEIESLETERDKWRQLVKDRKVTPESFVIFETDLTEKIQELQSRTLPPEFTNNELSNIRENWLETPMRERRRIVDGFLSVVIKPSVSGKKVPDLGIVITPI